MEMVSQRTMLQGSINGLQRVKREGNGFRILLMECLALATDNVANWLKSLNLYVVGKQIAKEVDEHLAEQGWSDGNGARIWNFYSAKPFSGVVVVSCALIVSMPGEKRKTKLEMEGVQQKGSLVRYGFLTSASSEHYETLLT
ncbi:hypothetical protein ACSBR1_042923 [Camellia fascicularis]